MGIGVATASQAENIMGGMGDKLLANAFILGDLAAFLFHNCALGEFRALAIAAVIASGKLL